MDYYMPEIYWHDKKPITSVDISKADFDYSSLYPTYRLVTASMEKQVRLWNFRFDKEPSTVNKDSLAFEFIADLAGHNAGVNIVRFSPNGEYIASGDSAGYLLLWKLSAAPIEPPSQLQKDDELPPNKENWVLSKRAFCMNEDVTYLSWSKCSRYLAVSSKASELIIYDVTNFQKKVVISNYRSFVNGIAWDPRGNFFATLSTDRKLDIAQLKNGYKVKTISTIKFPSTSSGPNTIESNYYKVFHDEQLMTFYRGLDYSPCGELLVAPSGVFETEDNVINGSFVFNRIGLTEGRPLIFIPNTRPTVRVSFSPHFYELRADFSSNYSGLPYRLIFAIMDKDSVKFYDSQADIPFAYVDQIHYDFLYDLTWSPDGEVVVISSNEGFNSFLKFKKGSLGVILPEIPQPVSDPDLFKVKVNQKKSKKNDEEKKKLEELTPKSSSKSRKKYDDNNKTPREQIQSEAVAKKETPTILKFFQRSKMLKEEKKPSLDDIIVIADENHTMNFATLTASDITRLTNKELIEACGHFNIPCGAITRTSRGFFEKKLTEAMSSSGNTESEDVIEEIFEEDSSVPLFVNEFATNGTPSSFRSALLHDDTPYPAIRSSKIITRSVTVPSPQQHKTRFETEDDKEENYDGEETVRILSEAERAERRARLLSVQDQSIVVKNKGSPVSTIFKLLCLVLFALFAFFFYREHMRRLQEESNEEL
uniref:LEM domain-containing protein n=1 Tax=Parastrongyloides trichosuri TaxID=131310 RepID=A0A0N4ZPQ1_PARTI